MELFRGSSVRVREARSGVGGENNACLVRVGDASSALWRMSQSSGTVNGDGAVDSDVDMVHAAAVRHVVAKPRASVGVQACRSCRASRGHRRAMLKVGAAVALPRPARGKPARDAHSAVRARAPGR